MDLSNAFVVVLGSDALATEFLKNLILPGIGRFLIIDDARVTAADLGSNFFLGDSSLGASRAESVLPLLLELNPQDVSGSARAESPATFFRSALLTQADLVVDCVLPLSRSLALESRCRHSSVPFLSIRANGLLANMRAGVVDHCVMQSRPDQVRSELRLTRPWAELLALDPDGQASSEERKRRHVPYPLLLLAARRALSASGGAVTREGLREWLKARAPPDSANFQEALRPAAMVLALDAADAPPPATVGLVKAARRRADANANANANASAEDAADIAAAEAEGGEGMELDDDGELQQWLDARERSTWAREDFWLLVRALGAFMEAEGATPLVGSLPDMEGHTDAYLALQAAYRAEADRHVAKMLELVRDLAGAAGRDPAAFPESLVRTFCQNSRHLNVAGNSGGRGGRAARWRAAREQWEGGEGARHAGWAIALEAAENFRETHGRWPGEARDAAADVQALLEEAEKEDRKAGTQEGKPLALEKLAQELCRYAGVKMHNICALMGGIAAQEAVKLITRQWIPITALFVFDGIDCSTASIFE